MKMVCVNCNICGIVLVLYATIWTGTCALKSSRKPGDAETASKQSSTESDIQSMLLHWISGNKLTFDGSGSTTDPGQTSQEKYQAFAGTNKTNWTMPADNQTYVTSSSKIQGKHQPQLLKTDNQTTAQDNSIIPVTVDRVVNSRSNISVSFSKLLWVQNQPKNDSQTTTQALLSRQKRQSGTRERASAPGRQPQQRIVLLMSRKDANRHTDNALNRLVNNNNGDILLVVRQPGGVKIDHRHLQHRPVNPHAGRQAANRLTQSHGVPSQPGGVKIDHRHLQHRPVNPHAGRQAANRLTQSHGVPSLNRSTLNRTTPTKSTLNRTTPTKSTLNRTTPTKSTLTSASPTKATLRDSPAMTTLKRVSPTRATQRRNRPTNPTRTSPSLATQRRNRPTQPTRTSPSPTGRALRRTIPTHSTRRRPVNVQRQNTRQPTHINNRRITGLQRQVASRRSSALGQRSNNATPTSRSLVRTMSSNDLLRRRQLHRHGNNRAVRTRTGTASQRSTGTGQRQVRQRQSRPDPFTQRFSAGFAPGSSLLEQPPMDFTGFDGTTGQQGGQQGGLATPNIGTSGPFRQFPRFNQPQFPDFSAPGFGGGLPRGPGMFI